MNHADKQLDDIEFTEFPNGIYYCREYFVESMTLSYLPILVSFMISGLNSGSKTILKKLTTFEKDLTLSGQEFTMARNTFVISFISSALVV